MNTGKPTFNSELHLDRSGQQALTLIHTKQRISFEENHQDAIRKLRAINDQKQKEAKP